MKIFSFGEDRSSISTPGQKDFKTHQEADDIEEDTETEEEEIGSLEEDVKHELKEEDSSLPEGWIMIPSANMKRVMSPEGKWFQGKRSALKYLIEFKYPEDKIEEFRACLVSDGWKNDPILPAGWLFKLRKNKQNVEFICEKGDHYRSRTEAMKSVMKEGDMEKVECLERFFKSFKSQYKGIAEGNSLDESWTSNDQGVPKGWMIRKINGKIQNSHFIANHVLSPDRQHFSSRRNALKFMIKKKYPLSEIEEMRECLKLDGWRRSSLLPQHWLYSERDGSKTYIDAEGIYYKSYLDILRNTEDDLIKSVLKTFLASQVSVYNGGKEVDSSWQSGPTVPDGWMIKEVRGQNLKNSFHVLSPEKQHFTGRRIALRFMIKQRYPADQIQAMRDCLKYDGWLQSPHLPLNWLYKAEKNGKSQFLDEQGNLYKSML